MLHSDGLPASEHVYSGILRCGRLQEPNSKGSAGARNKTGALGLVPQNFQLAVPVLSESGV